MPNLIRKVRDGRYIVAGSGLTINKYGYAQVNQRNTETRIYDFDWSEYAGAATTSNITLSQRALSASFVADGNSAKVTVQSPDTSCANVDLTATLSTGEIIVMELDVNGQTYEGRDYGL